MCSDALFGLSPLNITRGHKYKLYKKSSRINARCSFFAERVVNIWNSFPNSVDFSSVARFKRTVKEVNFRKFVNYTLLILLQMFDNNCMLCVGQQLAYRVYLVAVFHCLVFCRQCVCVL